MLTLFRNGSIIQKVYPLSMPNLEVYDYAEDKDGGHQVHEVGQVLPVEGLPQGADLVLAGG